MADKDQIREALKRLPQEYHKAGCAVVESENLFKLKEAALEVSEAREYLKFKASMPEAKEGEIKAQVKTAVAEERLELIKAEGNYKLNKVKVDYLDKQIQVTRNLCDLEIASIYAVDINARHVNDATSRKPGF